MSLRDTRNPLHNSGHPMNAPIAALYRGERETNKIAKANIMNTKSRAAALKHPHIHFPTAKDVRGWLQKRSTKEFEMNAALVALCSVLLGSVFFSLCRAFGVYQCGI